VGLSGLRASRRVVRDQLAARGDSVIIQQLPALINGSCCNISDFLEGAEMADEDEQVRWFAGRLRELREGAGLSREGLAERAGLKVGGVRDLEQGRREPGWRTVLALARALGVGCTAFLQEPAARPPAGPGRPRKAPPEDAGQQQPKRPRGRPRKGSGIAQDGPPADGVTSAPAKGKEPTAGQGRKRKR
jgi:transcriptional regulator with XRE-family HTH domain